MKRAYRVSWAQGDSRYAAHGLFRHVVDAVLWVLITHPGANAIVAKPATGARP